MCTEHIMTNRLVEKDMGSEKQQKKSETNAAHKKLRMEALHFQNLKNHKTKVIQK